MVHRKILLCALGLTLFELQFITAEMSGQTFRGGINGSVTDATGAVLPKALVKATNEATGFPLIGPGISEPEGVLVFGRI
jgi:hypothetical protein